MNLFVGAADLALQAADQFESVLFSAATAHANGFKSVWSMYGHELKIAGSCGAAVGVLSAIETAISGDPSSSGAEGIVMGIFASMFAGYITHTVYREQMFKNLTGSGTLKFKLTIFVGCTMVPAVMNAITAKSGSRKSGFLKGAAFGTFAYILIGCIPVIINEAHMEIKMRALFESCYPVNEASPCRDKDLDFVRVWTSFIPDWLNSALHIKEKANLMKVMDVLVQKQKLDGFRAIAHTPLFSLLSGIGSGSSSHRANASNTMYGMNSRLVL
jgi:hypothetical protein